MVIDVLRAFTTAVYAVEAGASPILLAADVAAAQALRGVVPHALLLSDGSRRDDLDLVNSPALVRSAPVGGRPLVMTTTHGTRAALTTSPEELLLCASFVNARATAGLLRDLGVVQVSYVASGGPDADEDVACGDYLAALAHDPATQPGPYLDRVRASAARAELDRRVARHDTGVHPDDVELCLQADASPFALVGARVHGTVMLLASHWQAGTALNC